MYEHKAIQHAVQILLAAAKLAPLERQKQIFSAFTMMIEHFDTVCVEPRQGETLIDWSVALQQLVEACAFLVATARIIEPDSGPKLSADDPESAHTAPQQSQPDKSHQPGADIANIQQTIKQLREEIVVFEQARIWIENYRSWRQRQSDQDARREANRRLAAHVRNHIDEFRRIDEQITQLEAQRETLLREWLNTDQVFWEKTFQGLI